MDLSWYTYKTPCHIIGKVAFIMIWSPDGWKEKKKFISNSRTQTHSIISLSLHFLTDDCEIIDTDIKPTTFNGFKDPLKFNLKLYYIVIILITYFTWLPITLRINNKLSMITHKVIHHTRLHCLSDQIIESTIHITN